MFVTYCYLLLLKTLDIITYALRLIKQNHPKVNIDIENLPIEKEVIKGIYANGDTKHIFQFDSDGMIDTLRKINPDSIDDIIAANAMYRPGPMAYIDNYAKTKKAVASGKGVVEYDCPQLEPILKETYGVIIYQEQVMRIVRDLAGYSLGRSDLVRRAMSKKKMDVLAAERKNFVYGNPEENIHGCIALGISEKAANTVFDKMISFAEYAFNKSHAAAYSVTSYMTAWLKYHYPVEFFAASLNFVNNIDEIPALIADARKHNIKVLRPDIHKSQANFTTENGNIRFGLAFLRGAKTRAQAIIDAREAGFANFREFVKCKPGKAMAEACILSGAMDSCGGVDNRLTLLNAFNVLDALLDKILNTEAKLEAIEDKNDPKALVLQSNLDALMEEWNNARPTPIPPMSLIERLNKELHYTSVFFTGNPLDHYHLDQDIVSINTLTLQNECWIAGFISEDEVMRTKRDGRQMLVGKITDYTETIPFIIFPEVYEKISNDTDKVMGFQGQLVQKRGEEEGNVQFIVNDVKKLSVKKDRISVWTDDFQAAWDILMNGRVTSNEGFPVSIVSPRGMTDTPFFATEEYILSNGLSLYNE